MNANNLLRGPPPLQPAPGSLPALPNLHPAPQPTPPTPASTTPPTPATMTAHPQVITSGPVEFVTFADILPAPIFVEVHGLPQEPAGAVR